VLVTAFLHLLSKGIRTTDLSYEEKYPDKTIYLVKTELNPMDSCEEKQLRKLYEYAEIPFF
jgi:hypothetical protein